MPERITLDERQRIVDLLHEHGGNRNQVARDTGWSKSLVQKIAVQEGIPSENGHKTKRATEVSRAMREVDRMEGILIILEVGQELLGSLKGQPPTPETMRAFKDGVMGYAIGVDKHRLETGEVTNRTENRSSDDSLEKAFQKLDSEMEKEEQEEGST